MIDTKAAREKYEYMSEHASEYEMWAEVGGLVPDLCDEIDRTCCLLRELEWQDDEPYVGVCPICWRNRRKGHSPLCKIAIALGRETTP
jgi:hypothetical protein